MNRSEENNQNPSQVPGYSMPGRQFERTVSTASPCIEGGAPEGDHDSQDLIDTRLNVEGLKRFGETFRNSTSA